MRFRREVGAGAHVEYLAQIIINSLFVSKGHRPDTALTLVLENASDYSRAITLSGDSLGDLGPITEAHILDCLAECLTEAEGLAKEASVNSRRGMILRAISFEHLVKGCLAEAPVYLLDRKGTDIRSVDLASDAVILLTDHVPIAPKLRKSLLRQGVQTMSLGPVMLHASQCVVIVQNEVDRQQ